MQATTLEEKLWRPLFHTTRKYYVFLTVLILGVAWFAFAWITQLRTGLVVTGMRDIPGGAPWGIYLVNFIFYIGIAHAGIAIAAGIRLLGLRDYIPIGRMAELLTIFGLMMAGLSILMDLGRPDRVFNVFRYFPQRVAPSPLVWDITAIVTYLVISITYLYIEMREDLARLAKKVKWGWLYRLLLPGYEPGERERSERIIWWASIFILPIMVMVHSTVGWIFGLQVSRPGWYSAIIAPYFLLGALLSGLAAVVVVVGIYRRVFHWEDLIKEKVFRGLGLVLSWFSILYLYFLLSEFLTVKFAGPLGELDVSVLLTDGRYAWPYWLQIGALAVAFVIFFINRVFPKTFSIGWTVFASALVVVTLWVTRFLILVPPLIRPYLPYPAGSYTPTWVEWSLVGGTFVLMAVLYMLFTKFFPIVSLSEIESAAEEA
jgi:molybdopterin-containing oxidoreductase family membrane subunit